MKVSSVKFTVLYNNKNITQDISRYMLSITYNDKTEGESDEIEIQLEDTDSLWQNGWYPEKGASLTVTIGYEHGVIKCGGFEIDEIELTGPPDTVTIKGIASGIKNTLKTRKSDAHENKTLRQIAEKVAAKNGLTISGTVPDISIGRITQNKETDLGFLRRISKDYGIVFSVREKTITFTSIYDLEKRSISFTLDKTDLSAYSIKDKADGIVKNAKVSHANAKKNEKVEVNLEYEKYLKETGQDNPGSSNENTQVSHAKAENKQQAEAKAKAIMHLSSSNQFEGNLSLQGNILALAGNNFQLNGVGVLSGKYHIKSSSHKIDKSSGYTTELEVKRLNIPLKSQQKTIIKKKSQPKNTQVSSGFKELKKDLLGNIDFFTKQ